jgi:hypothetical protein
MEAIMLYATEATDGALAGIGARGMLVAEEEAEACALTLEREEEEEEEEEEDEEALIAKKAFKPPAAGARSGTGVEGGRS